MIIKQITLNNFRHFKEISVKLHPKLNVFCGNNASGKTSFLEAICCGVSRYFSHCATPGVPLKAKDFLLSDIRSWSEEKTTRRGTELKKCYAADSSILVELKYAENKYAWTVMRTISSTKLLNDGAKVTARLVDAFNVTDKDNSCNVPIICYYGPHRGAAQGAKKRFHKKVDYENPFSSYYRALDPALDFKSFLEWFSEESAAQGAGYKSVALETVQKALGLTLSNQELICSKPRFLYRPKRFVIDCHHKDTPDQVDVVDFDQLSDGYRSMIALVADIARRLSIANPTDIEDPLNGDGVLIIDEIDVHLHPRWQATVLRDLAKIFPNFQIIVTTHSPIILASVKRENVFTLTSKEEFNYSMEPTNFQTDGLCASSILLKVMGVDDCVPSEKDPEMEMYHNAIDKGTFEQESYQKLRRELEEFYGENHPRMQLLYGKEKSAEFKRLIQARKKSNGHASD